MVPNHASRTLKTPEEKIRAPPVVHASGTIELWTVANQQPLHSVMAQAKNTMFLPLNNGKSLVH